MNLLTRRLAPFFTVLMMVACATSRDAAGGRGDAPEASAPPQQIRTLTLITDLEPLYFAANRDTDAGVNPEFSRIFGARLVVPDERGVPMAQLAEAVPQLNTDSWRVFPDGTMETVYRLRPGLTWHDGTPLTAEDLLFSWRVYSHPDFLTTGILGPRGAPIDEVRTPDSRTVVFRWKRLYAEEFTFEPLARHLLEPAFEQIGQTGSDTFLNHPYWTTEWVGLGPYRVDRWEPGGFIEGSAFDGYALGAPKIKRVKITWATDPNTALANLLAGAGDMAVDNSILFQQAAVLSRDWAPRTGGVILLSTEKARYFQVQLRPEYANPPAIGDVRVRRALAHAVDRQALVDGLFDGQSRVADTIVAPEAAYYLLVDAALSKYPYDPRRTEQLLGELGITRSAGGTYRGRAGEPFTVGVLSDVENEANIVRDGFQRAGLAVETHVMTALESRDNQLRSTFPTLGANVTGLLERTVLGKLYGPKVAAPDNRWTESNKGGWMHPEYDRIYTAITTSLDFDERNRQIAQAMKLVSEDVPLLTLYYTVSAAAHVGALRGPTSFAPAGQQWVRIHEWEWR